jgi:hypothetical protein
MSVKNIDVFDGYLVGLLDGRTTAESGAWQRLADRGHVTIVRGRPQLTKRGRARAMKLRALKDWPRMMSGFSGTGKCTIEMPSAGAVRRR